MASDDSETMAVPPAATSGETRSEPAGLTGAEASRRLAEYGENALAEKRTSPLARLAAYFWGPIPWMIEIAAVLSGLVAHWADLSIICALLVLNAGVGFWQEFKADTAISALKQRLALRARVLRDGQWRDLPARELVPGDVVLIRLGNIVPADVRLVEGDYLSVDQSALTGESLPVEKKAGDSAFSGSIAKLGEMKAVVTATGMNTYFGKTARLVERAGTVSHFQLAVLRIGNFLILCTIGLVAIILLDALYYHDPLVETLLFALILTVAAIPVALPAVLSVTMAVGAERLARLKAIVSRLVSGHLTIYLTRNKGAIWQRPWPSWPFVVVTESTKILGTLAAVYGWFITPIGWEYAGLVWAYSFAWFFVNSGFKIMAYALLQHRGPGQAEHLARVESPLTAGGVRHR